MAKTSQTCSLRTEHICGKYVESVMDASNPIETDNKISMWHRTQSKMFNVIDF